jgi:hypothetical protein
MGIEQEGSIAFRLKHSDKDWATNDQGYRFNPVQIGTVTAWAYKHPNHKVEFRLTGPLNSEITLQGDLPPVGEHGLHVVITWTKQQVQLYLDARPHSIVRLPATAPQTPGGKPDA